MGRGKIEIKRIESSTNRQVTFSKRRNGIFKKAREISILCESQVSVVIFSSSGKLYEYCSPTTTLSQLLEKYQQNSGKKIWTAKHEDLYTEIERIRKENDSMQIQLRHLKGEDLNSLNHKDLSSVEESLENGYNKVREKQMEVWKMHRENSGLLEEENKELTYLWVQRGHHVPVEERVRDLDIGYHSRWLASSHSL